MPIQKDPQRIAEGENATHEVVTPLFEFNLATTSQFYDEYVPLNAIFDDVSSVYTGSEGVVYANSDGIGNNAVNTSANLLSHPYIEPGIFGTLEGGYQPGFRFVRANNASATLPITPPGPKTVVAVLKLASLPTDPYSWQTIASFGDNFTKGNNLLIMNYGSYLNMSWRFDITDSNGSVGYDEPDLASLLDTNIFVWQYNGGDNTNPASYTFSKNGTRKTITTSGALGAYLDSSLLGSFPLIHQHSLDGWVGFFTIYPGTMDEVSELAIVRSLGKQFHRETA